MKNRTLALRSICLSAAVTVALAAAPTLVFAQSTPAEVNKAQVGGPPLHTNSDKLPHADGSFLAAAAQSDAAELEASKMALQKSQSDVVKKFAQQMITDHTKTAEEGSALAQKKGLTLEAKPSVAAQAKLKLLSASDGANFDKRYASSIGVSAHEDAVKLFQKESKGGKDADVKAWATQTLPALQHHLEMAKALDTSMSK